MYYINKYANIIIDIKNRDIKNINYYNVQFKIKDILIILYSKKLTYNIKYNYNHKTHEFDMHIIGNFNEEFENDGIEIINKQVFNNKESSDPENKPHPKNNNISINKSDLNRFIDRNKNNRFVIKIKYGLWTYNPGSFRIKVLRPYIDHSHIMDDTINERIAHMNNKPIDLALDEYDNVINGWIKYYNYLFTKFDKLYYVQFIINDKNIITIDRNHNIVYSVKKSYKLLIAGILIASIMIAITIFLSGKYNRG